MKAYFKYFRILFIIVGVLIVVNVITMLGREDEQVTYVRANDECKQQERVFDGADKLTDAEEDELRSLIAEKEDEAGCDIIIMTIADSSIGSDSAMMNAADDFYDENMFGYNKPYGDGAIYLDNWANGYVWFSTCGRVESTYSTSMINTLIDDVCENVNEDPFSAYKEYVISVSDTMTGKNSGGGIPLIIAIPLALVATIVYIVIGIWGNKGKKTTTGTTYVAGGAPDFTDMRDTFVTKHTTSRKIETNSGGGGHHTSSGGISHGGGGGRH